MWPYNNTEEIKGHIFNRIPTENSSWFDFLLEPTNFYLTQNNTISMTEVKLHLLSSNFLEWTASKFDFCISSLKGLFHIVRADFEILNDTLCIGMINTS